MRHCVDLVIPSIARELFFLSLHPLRRLYPLASIIRCCLGMSTPFLPRLNWAQWQQSAIYWHIFVSHWHYAPFRAILLGSDPIVLFLYPKVLPNTRRFLFKSSKINPSLKRN